MSQQESSVPSVAMPTPSRKAEVPWAIVGSAMAVCLLMTAGAYWFGLHPAAAALAERRSLEDELSQREKKADLVAAELVAVKRKLEQTRLEVSALPLRLEPATAINRRLNRLAESAQAAGVTVHELQPSAVVDGPHYQTIPIRLAGSGAYPACAAFLHALRVEFPDVTIRSFEATNPSVARDGNAAAFRLELDWHTTPLDRKS